MLEQYVVAPYMFKHLIGKGHPEISTGRQQDVSEFFMFFLEQLKRAERTALPRIVASSAITTAGGEVLPTSSVFEFHMSNRYFCTESGAVKYTKIGLQTLNNVFELPVPLEAALNKADVDEELQHDAKRQRIEERIADPTTAAAAALEKSSMEKQAESKLIIPFEACLQHKFKPETLPMANSLLGRPSLYSKTTSFRSFPKYLMVKVARYYAGQNWVQMKINARVPMPEQLDLTPFKGSGVQPGEQDISDEPTDSVTSNGAAAGATSAAVEPDLNLVSELTMMGFSENGCKRAAIATNNANSEIAMNWVLEHMDDPDFNDPLPSAGPGADNTIGASAATTGSSNSDLQVDAGAMDMLAAMGYTSEQTRAALIATDNNIERFVILFSYVM